MNLPSPFELGFSSIIYLIMGYILIRGCMQIYQSRVKGQISKRSFVPLGALALIIGLIAYFYHIKLAFDAIAEAGDISPSLVAGGMSYAFGFPVLGLIGLGISYLIKYLNQ